MVKIQEEEDVQLNPNPIENLGETDRNQVKLEATKDILKLKMVKPVVSGVAISEQLSIYHPNIKIETVKVRVNKLSLLDRPLFLFGKEGHKLGTLLENKVQVVLPFFILLNNNKKSMGFYQVLI